MNAPTGKRLMLIEVDDLIVAIGALETRAEEMHRLAQDYEREGHTRTASDRRDRAAEYDAAVKRLRKAMEESR